MSKRTKKMYEYKAVTSQAQRLIQFSLGHNPLGLAKADMSRISGLAQQAYNALESLHCELEDMIEDEKLDIALAKPKAVSRG